MLILTLSPLLDSPRYFWNDNTGVVLIKYDSILHSPIDSVALRRRNEDLKFGKLNSNHLYRGTKI